MSDKIDVHNEVQSICDKLGLEPERVLRLDMYPFEFVVEVAKLNDDGAKFIDEETNEPAKEVLTFAVAT